MVVPSMMRLLYFAGCVGVAEERVSSEERCSKQSDMSILEISSNSSESFHKTCLLDSSEPSLLLSIIPSHCYLSCNLFCCMLENHASPWKTKSRSFSSGLSFSTLPPIMRSFACCASQYFTQPFFFPIWFWP